MPKEEEKKEKRKTFLIAPLLASKDYMGLACLPQPRIPKAGENEIFVPVWKQKNIGNKYHTITHRKKKSIF